MLLCIAVTHEFLIRIYLLMTNQLEQHHGKLKVYARVVLIVFTTDFVVDGVRFCDPGFNSFEYYTLQIKIRKTVLSVVLGIINFAVTYKVSRQIKRKLNSNKNVHRTVILGCLIEVIIAFRLVLLWRQYVLKSNYIRRWHYYLVAYMTSCELVTFTLLLAAMVNQINFLKKRYL